MSVLNNKKLKGVYLPPGDKSISHRIIILGSQAVGKSSVTNLLESEDVLNTVKVMRQLGSNIKKIDGKYIIFGLPPGTLFEPKKELNFGNSGTSIRLITGLLSTNNIKTKLVGDKSLSSRPMKRVTEHLKRIGAVFILKKNNFLPMTIKGSANPIPLNYEISIPSAQIKSAVMLSALNTLGKVTIKEFSSTRDHTERMLKTMNYNILFKEKKEFRYITMSSDKELNSLNYKVAGDPSSAAFMITAASLKIGSKIKVKNMLYNPTRIGFLLTLKRMGANIVIKNKRIVHNEVIADIFVHQKKQLKSVVVEANEVPQQIDEIPILSIAASFAKGETIFKDLKELTVKESNRLDLIYQNLKKMGVDCFIKNYDLHIMGNNNLKVGGAKIIHNFDHRIVMSFYIANMICSKNNIIIDKSCVKTSYPQFFKDFNTLIK
ncbi:MAG: 3-phosphoshikimate 1-carboxyvinyltransferase [Alphaproteobacteria bacterium]|jgi:3-phosphoshikimate 1-carboxyvinyltransferase|tara:strand:+ start:1573 stop:2871 length:1299 start_codon:yes stop_codon:yes gene_type:complete